MNPIRKDSFVDDASGSAWLGRSCDGVVEVDGDAGKSEEESGSRDASRRVDRSRIDTRRGRSLED